MGHPNASRRGILPISNNDGESIFAPHCLLLVVPTRLVRPCIPSRAYKAPAGSMRANTTATAHPPCMAQAHPTRVQSPGMVILTVRAGVIHNESWPSVQRSLAWPSQIGRYSPNMEITKLV
jgi:hypothetical protein